MLSSQPKRSWGDLDSEAENERPEFELTAEDWPPTPPKPRPAKPSTTTATTSSTSSRAVGRSGSSTSLAKAAGGGGSTTHSTGFSRAVVSKPAAAAGPSRPLQAKPSFTKDAGAKKPLAPIFRTASAGSSSSSTSSSRPITAGSSAFAFNNPATARSTGSVLPAKRALPWEQLEESASRSSRSGSANFHELSGPGVASKLPSGIKGKLLTSDSMDIKQKVVLSPEQQMVLKMVVENGKNVFFTGSAGASFSSLCFSTHSSVARLTANHPRCPATGTGKSVLLREIIASLKRKFRGNTDAVAVTASTGMAACNIGGTTIHSFGGIGLGLGTAEQLVGNIRKNKQAVSRWQRCKVLVIDEGASLALATRRGIPC